MQWVAVRVRHDFDAAFAAIERDKAGAVIAIPDNLINDQAANIARFAGTFRIPAISGWAEFAEAGNLMSYGPDARAYYRRVAGYVDKLLRGARPADLPVELPTEFELVVNLRAARTPGDPRGFCEAIWAWVLQSVLHSSTGAKLDAVRDCECAPA